MFLAPRHERSDGFTLIELLVVMIVIGLLAGIAIPVFTRQRNQAYDTKAKATLAVAIQTQRAQLVERGMFSRDAAALAAAEASVNWIDSTPMIANLDVVGGVYFEPAVWPAGWTKQEITETTVIYGIKSESGRCFYARDLQVPSHPPMGLTYYSDKVCQDPWMRSDDMTQAAP